MSADTDGDGNVEFVFAAGSHVYARQADTGAECWSAELPAPAAQVLYAAGGKEKESVLVATTRGDLLALAPASYGK